MKAVKEKNNEGELLKLIIALWIELKLAQVNKK
jgi:hypothetical protein